MTGGRGDPGANLFDRDLKCLKKRGREDHKIQKKICS